MKAKCTCKGGQDGGCKHISAAMYSLEDLLNTRCTDSITSGPCQWVKRPTASSKPCEIKNLIIGKLNSPLKRRTKAKVLSHKKRPLGKRTKATKKPPTTPARRKKKRKDHIFCENIDVDVRNEDQRRDPSPEFICKFISRIKENPGKAPAILNLLQNTYMPEEDFYECNEKSVTKSNKATSTHSNGIMKEKLMQFSSRKDVVATLENEVQEIFTPDEI